MGRMITISTRDLLNFFYDAGWYIARTRGSHLILKHDVNPKTMIVPYRRSDISTPLVKRLMREAGLISKKIKNMV